MKVVTALPAYNERANIEPLIEALPAAFGRLRHDREFLVVDDSRSSRLPHHETMHRRHACASAANRAGDRAMRARHRCLFDTCASHPQSRIRSANVSG